MSNFNPSTKETINNLAQDVSSLQQQLDSITQSKFNMPTFDVARSLFDDIVRVVPPKNMEVPQLEM